MPNLTEKWLSPKQIAEQYSVDRETARRWIKRILGDDVHYAQKQNGRQAPLSFASDSRVGAEEAPRRVNQRVGSIQLRRTL